MRLICQLRITMGFGFIGPNAGELSRGTALEWRRKTSGIARVTAS
jgi:hypothetical protein